METNVKQLNRNTMILLLPGKETHRCPIRLVCELHVGCMCVYRLVYAYVCIRELLKFIIHVLLLFNNVNFLPIFYYMFKIKRSIDQPKRSRLMWGQSQQQSVSVCRAKKGVSLCFLTAKKPAKVHSDDWTTSLTWKIKTCDAQLDNVCKWFHHNQEYLGLTPVQVYSWVLH